MDSLSTAAASTAASVAASESTTTVPAASTTTAAADEEEKTDFASYRIPDEVIQKVNEEANERPTTRPDNDQVPDFAKKIVSAKFMKGKKRDPQVRYIYKQAPSADGTTKVAVIKKAI